MISGYTNDLTEIEVFSLEELQLLQTDRGTEFSAEDLGFLVATLSPSLRRIPTASTHLPKINCIALTHSSPPTGLQNMHTTKLQSTCKYTLQ